MPTIGKNLVRSALVASAAACSSPGGLGPYGGDVGGGYGFVGSGGGGRSDAGVAGEDGGSSTDGGTAHGGDGGSERVEAGIVPDEGGAANMNHGGGVDAESPQDGESAFEGGSGVGVSISAPAAFFTSLDWTISGPGGLYSGTVFFGDAQSLEFVVGGIQMGSDYTLTLNGTDRYGDECSGTSAPFEVSTGAVTGAGVVIVCPHAGDASETAVVRAGSVSADASVGPSSP
jgi:hypothetical protein